MNVDGIGGLRLNSFFGGIQNTKDVNFVSGRGGRTLEIVRQKNSWSCYACVAATITGETLNDVVSFLGHDGSEKVEWSKHPDKYRGFTMDEINMYLASRHFTLGVIGADIGGMEADIASKYERIDVQVPFSIPAVIIVKSSLFNGVSHCLYWDGKHAFDPYHDGPVELKNYELLEWWPAIKLESHGTFNRMRIMEKTNG